MNQLLEFFKIKIENLTTINYSHIMTKLIYFLLTRYGRLVFEKNLARRSSH